MMNMNEVMMFGVLLVLMIGPDTGPPAAAPSTAVTVPVSDSSSLTKYGQAACSHLASFTVAL